MQFVNGIEQIHLQFTGDIAANAEADSGGSQRENAQKEQCFFIIGGVAIRWLVHGAFTTLVDSNTQPQTTLTLWLARRVSSLASCYEQIQELILCRHLQHTKIRRLADD